MAFDERLAVRVQKALAPRRNVTERKMFGGICYMLNGHMACGIVEDKLMVRGAPEDTAAWQRRPHVKPMDFTGRPLKGFVYVEHEGTKTAAQLKQWIERAAAFAESQPPKKSVRR